MSVLRASLMIAVSLTLASLPLRSPTSAQPAPAADNETTAPARAAKLDKLVAKPNIDGVIVAGEWQGAVKLELRNQIQPGDNAAPSEKTEVFLAYDREHLYLAFHAYDSEPAAIRARVVRRDDVYLDDYVSVYLDTFNDRRRAYALYFNPLGIQADGVIIGYNDLLYHSYDPLGQRRDPGAGLFRLRRTLFLKLSYNFRV